MTSSASPDAVARVDTIPVPGRHGQPGHVLHRCRHGWELHYDGQHVRFLNEFEQRFVDAAISATAAAASAPQPT